MENFEQFEQCNLCCKNALCLLCMYMFTLKQLQGLKATHKCAKMATAAQSEEVFIRGKGKYPKKLVLKVWYNRSESLENI